MTFLPDQVSDTEQDSLTTHQQCIKKVKPLENQLRGAMLKWYDVYGSHLDHDLADNFKESARLHKGSSWLCLGWATEPTRHPPDTILFIKTK